jgi:signal transduction histidine kinase
MVLLRWDVGDFQREFARSPELTRGILKVLTGKLRQDVQALQAANAALAALNQQLEDRVQKRTAALQQKTEELEEANRQIQEASERRSRFLTGMSHELRTPVTAIVGSTRMVLRRAGDILPERHRDNLTKVIHSADRLPELISGLLDLSKIEAGAWTCRPDGLMWGC